MKAWHKGHLLWRAEPPCWTALLDGGRMGVILRENLDRGPVYRLSSGTAEGIFDTLDAAMTALEERFPNA